MTAITITKIRAVQEDPEHPETDCYGTVALAVLKAANTVTNHPAPKADNMTHHNNEQFFPALRAGAQKRGVAGINANNNPAALIDVLARLGLCPHEATAPLKKLAASGAPLEGVFSVSVWDLDRALAETNASVSQRMAFKASLSAAGLLTVPK